MDRDNKHQVKDKRESFSNICPWIHLYVMRVIMREAIERVQPYHGMCYTLALIFLFHSMEHRHPEICS